MGEVLLVDMGNTRIKSAVWRNGVLIDDRACAWDEQPEAAIFTKMWAGSHPSRVVCCNVAGAARADALRRWCRSEWAIDAEFVCSSAAFGDLRCAYENPDNLGDDRWVAVIGGRARYGEPVCVIDCGTATTVDLVAAGGLHLGGAILPGIRTMRAALARNTADLPQAQGEPAPFSSDTVPAIAGGTAYALAGAIERLVNEARDRVDGTLVCVITGGEAAQLLPLLRFEVEHEPQLVLYGLVEAAKLS